MDPVFKHYEHEIHKQMQDAASTGSESETAMRGRLPHNVNLKFGRPDQDTTRSGRYPSTLEVTGNEGPSAQNPSSAVFLNFELALDKNRASNASRIMWWSLIFGVCWAPMLALIVMLAND